jgi:DNA-directed RNA polymerase specialized sigma24 family protein
MARKKTSRKRGFSFDAMPSRRLKRGAFKAHQFAERGSLAAYPATDWSRRADESVLDAELPRAIQEATDSLPEGYREVFLLKDVGTG